MCYSIPFDHINFLQVFMNLRFLINCFFFQIFFNVRSLMQLSNVHHGEHVNFNSFDKQFNYASAAHQHKFTMKRTTIRWIRWKKNIAAFGGKTTSTTMHAQLLDLLITFLTSNNTLPPVQATTDTVFTSSAPHLQTSLVQSDIYNFTFKF